MLKKLEALLEQGLNVNNSSNFLFEEELKQEEPYLFVCQKKMLWDCKDKQKIQTCLLFPLNSEDQLAIFEFPNAAECFFCGILPAKSNESTFLHYAVSHLFHFFEQARVDGQNVIYSENMVSDQDFLLDMKQLQSISDKLDVGEVLKKRIPNARLDSDWVGKVAIGKNEALEKTNRAQMEGLQQKYPFEKHKLDFYFDPQTGIKRLKAEWAQNVEIDQRRERKMLEELLSIKIFSSTPNKELREYQLAWNSEYYKFLKVSTGKKLLSDREKTLEIAKRFITQNKVERKIFDRKTVVAHFLNLCQAGLLSPEQVL